MKTTEPAQDVTQVIPNHSDWTGFRWTEAGKYLVGPDGDQLTAQRIKGLMWRDHMELRLAGHASRKSAEKNRANRQKVKVVVVDLGDYRDKHFGRAAG